MATHHIPKGHHTLGSHIIVKGGNDAIEFYKKAFDAKELSRIPGLDGKTVMHAELQLGDSILMLCDEFPKFDQLGPDEERNSPVRLQLYVEDCDAVYRRAIEAGATSEMEPQDTFWGDRYSKVRDPFGHSWGIATHKEDLSPEEIQERAKKAYKG